MYLYGLNYVLKIRYHYLTIAVLGFFNSLCQKL